MFWPFTSSGGSSSSNELDPTLQEFVKAQGPAQYSTSQSSRQSPSTQPPSSSPSLPNQQQQQQNAASSSASSSSSNNPAAAAPKWTVPTAFPDGRYAELWKSYKPLQVTLDETRSESERIGDVLLSYNDRDNKIKKVALENCWPEGLACQRCNQKPPTMHDRWTMCRDYTRRLEHCYVTQVRFLRALGYLSDRARPREVEEDIQLHADDLYRRMQAQERMVDEAKAKGEPAPVFAPVLASEISRAVGARPVVVGHRAADGSVKSPTMNDEPDEPDNPALPPEARGVSQRTQKNLRERLKRMGGDERAIERLAIANEIKTANETATLYSQMSLQSKAERDERRKAGTATLGDRISGLFGW